jgi:signal transduction histidine kinase
MKDEFIGVAAHELRTPVAALKGAIETLLMRSRQGYGAKLADWQQEMMDEIDLATDRLTTLAEDLLDVTRLQAGQLEMHRAPTDVIALTRRVVARIQRTTTRRELSMVVRPTPAISDMSGQKDADNGMTTPETTEPIVANVDPMRIEQVLTNLITNALKYSPNGGVVQIRLTRHEDESGAVVEWQVQDSGIGIPARQQNLIFGRFMRADNVRRAGIIGSGLGLYITHGVITQHGGRIWFESEEGIGTTFFFTLPFMLDVSAI